MALDDNGRTRLILLDAVATPAPAQSYALVWLARHYEKEFSRHAFEVDYETACELIRLLKLRPSRDPGREFVYLETGFLGGKTASGIYKRGGSVFSEEIGLQIEYECSLFFAQNLEWFGQLVGTQLEVAETALLPKSTMPNPQFVKRKLWHLDAWQCAYNGFRFQLIGPIGGECSTSRFKDEMCLNCTITTSIQDAKDLAREEWSIPEALWKEVPEEAIYSHHDVWISED